MEKSTFYHAGCPVCNTAEKELMHLIDANKINVVHLGKDKSKIAEAKEKGVNSVPAIVTPNGNVLHINFGASMDEVVS